VFGRFKKKSPASAPLHSAEAEPERYSGRPLLIVLENYVLDCIGELGPDKQALARSVVQRVWGGGDDWKATVREQLKLLPSTDEALHGMWSRNQCGKGVILIIRQRTVRSWLQGWTGAEKSG